MATIPKNRKMSDEQLIESLNEGLSAREISSKYDVNLRSVQRRKAALSPTQLVLHRDTDIVAPGFELSGTSKLLRHDHTTGEKYITQEWVKTTRAQETQLAILKEAVKAFMDDLPKVPTITRMNEHLTKDDLMCVFPIGDLHVGMMAWKDESGNDWSLKHVEAAVQLVFSELVRTAPAAKKAVILNLGDYGHRDGRNAVTPNHGHPLDVDSRFPKMVRMCIRLERFLVELMLTKFEEVDLRNVSGNHDPALSVVLAEAMSNIYENNPRVFVDTSPNPVKYIEWGKTMIATTHGDTIKWERFAGVVANDQAEMWGRTKFRYGMTGHIHSENKKEFAGMVCESYRTLAAADSFAAWFGWRSGRDSRCIVFSKDLGKKTEHIEPIDMCQEILDQID